MNWTGMKANEPDSLNKKLIRGTSAINCLRPSVTSETSHQTFVINEKLHHSLSASFSLTKQATGKVNDPSCDHKISLYAVILQAEGRQKKQNKILAFTYLHK